MTSPIRPQPGILDIALYQGGASHVTGRADALKLSSNENPWGPSPAAMAAYSQAAATLHRYPSTDHATLRTAIAEVHGLDADRVICGAGSDEVIHWLCQAYAGPGDEVLYPEHGFLMYRISAMAAGATPVEARERDRVVDVDALLAAATDRTRLVFLANPANPTGTMIGQADLARLADGLPAQAILVLDGAYAEFAPGYDGGLALVEGRENVVMMRTFSKLYGLGGLRIGWGYGPRAIIDVLNRIRGPFNLSNAQLAAGAAAVRDRTHADHSRDETIRLRATLRDALLAAGLACDESHANFVLARFADEAEARACDAALRAEGILVRHVASYKLPQCLRITVGRPEDCARVADVVRRFKAAQAGAAA